MKKEFLINIAFLITINLLIKPFYIFGIDIPIQNAVGAERYGLYFSLFNFTFMAQIINDFGIQNYNNRTISQHKQLIYKFIPNILVLKILLAIAYLFIVGIFCAMAWLSGYGYNYEELGMIFLLAFNWILISLVQYLRSNISGLTYYKTDSVLSALDKLLMIITCSILLWVWPGKAHFKIVWLIYAQTFAFVTTALVASIILYKIIHPVRFKINPKYMHILIRESWPYALLGFLMLLYSRIDAVMLERLLPDGAFQAGIYASAYRLLDAVNMIGFLFAGLLLPMFSRMIKENENIQELLRLSIQLILVFSIPFALNTIFFRGDLMNWLYNDADMYWGNVLAWLMVAFVAVSTNYILGTLLTANGSLMKMNRVFIFGVLLNVSLNYWLIFEYKALGTAATTCITQVFILVVQMILVKKEFQLSTDFKVILQIIFFAVVCGILGYYSKVLYPDLEWKIKFIVSMIGALGAAILTGLFSPSAILLLLKK